jgi:hypothetical protein
MLSWRYRYTFLASLLAFTAVVSGCKRPEGKKQSQPTSLPVAQIDPQVIAERTAAKLGAAQLKLDAKRYDDALVRIVNALQTNLDSPEAKSMLVKILLETTWTLPEVTITHAAPIDQLFFAAPSSLWVNLGGKANTTVLWDLDTMSLKSVLFPHPTEKNRSLLVGPQNRFTIIERGETTLLCNAKTLKPICDLGRIPESLTASSVIAFSADGLLVAHPSDSLDQNHSIIWHLRDCTTGQIIRTSQPIAEKTAKPLAAVLNPEALRVIHNDGSLLEIPISPIKPIQEVPMPESVTLSHAQFSADGNEVLVLQDSRENQPASQSIISYNDREDGSLTPEMLARRFPWNLQPNIWSGLMSAAEDPPFSAIGKSLTISHQSHTPIELMSPITALAFGEKAAITGEQNGTILLHRLLPLPAVSSNPPPPNPINHQTIIALIDLTKALAGCYYSPEKQAILNVTAEDRVAALAACDFGAIRLAFPQLDFSPLIAEFAQIKLRHTELEHFQMLDDRLARTVSDKKNKSNLEKIFRKGKSTEVMAAIQSAGGKGEAIATALALALKSDQPEWIEACLASATDLPPLLRHLTLSRISWLRDRKADVIANWPEVSPDLAEVCRREDWDGWEQADFTPALKAMNQNVREQLAALTIPEKATEKQRKAAILQLDDPATIHTVGSRKYMNACMNAAIALSNYKEEAKATFRLAKIAHDLGAPAPLCLRIEATALTNSGNYQEAHARWIELITEHPLEAQLPSDYTEAAYSAFENMNPDQALEILKKGLLQFPNNGGFAARAGWIALLTGNSAEAYQFLLKGEVIGFPQDQLDQSTAMLTIAAAQAGAAEEAKTYFQKLIQINPKWENAKTLQQLDWPEEIKLTLKSLMR